MKFKVINDSTKKVAKSNLTIHEARKIAHDLNKLEVDYFYITCNQKDKEDWVGVGGGNIRNGEVVTELIERENITIPVVFNIYHPLILFLKILLIC